MLQIISGALSLFSTQTQKAFTLSHGLINMYNVPTQTCVLSSYTDGTVIEIFYDPKEAVIVYNANVTTGSFAAVGYGKSMTDTDMCFWSAKGASSIQEDLYSTG